MWPIVKPFRKQGAAEGNNSRDGAQLARTRQQSALVEISRIALSTTDIEAFLERTVHVVAEALQCPKVSIMELDPQIQCFHIRARFGFEEPTPRPISVADQSQAAFTLGQEGVVRMADARTETRFAVHPLLRQAGVRSSLSVRIAAQPHTYGVICAFSPHEDHYAEEDCAFLQSLSNIVAVVLEKGQQAQERLQSEERYRTFFEQSTQAIWRFDVSPPWVVGGSEADFLHAAYSHGSLAECNQAFAEQYGFEHPRQIIGATIQTLLSSDPKNEAMLRDFYRSGFRLQNAETSEQDRHGNKLYFSNTLLGIVHAGRLVSAWGTQQDITLQRAAERERAALLSRESAAVRSAHRLQEITAALAGALTTQAVAEIIVDSGVSALNAWAGALFLPPAGQTPENATQLTLLRSTGYNAPTRQAYATLDLADALPVCQAFKEGHPLLLPATDEGTSAHPGLQEVTRHPRTKAIAALPLLVENRVIGVLSLSFAENQSFQDNELAFMLTLAGQCAQALERAHLLQELENERGRFEAILRQMPSAVLIAAGASGQIILSNQRVEAIWKPSAPLARTVDEYGAYEGYFPDGSRLQPEDWPLARALHQGEATTGQELTIRRGDGSLAVIHANATPIRDKGGAVSAAVLVFEDNTRRAHADRAQRVLAATATALLGSLDENEVIHKLADICTSLLTDWCLVSLMDENQNLTETALVQHNPQDNRSAQRHLAKLQQSTAYPFDVQGVIAAGNPCLNLQLRPALPNEPGQAYRQLQEELQPHSVLLAPLVARGRVKGVMIWLSTQPGRLYDDHDTELAAEIARRVALVLDNARLFAESQLATREAEAAVAQAQQARDEAQNANRAKDEFLAVVSHELRTPLTPILGWTELLRDPGTDQAIRNHAYDVIERNARSQAQLINDILDVSRITTGKLRLELKTADLAPIVKCALDSMRTASSAKKITLKEHIEDVGSVRLDADRMQQVVWNLLQNALKFTPEGGSVEVRLDREGEEAVLTVSDNGIGLEPEFIPHVFEQFRQADSSPTRPAGGLGLGLAIVRHISELHGGKVTASSAGKGQGATFTVRLPLEKTSAPTLEEKLTPIQTVPQPALNPAGSAPRALEEVRILLVEDDEDTRGTLCKLLEKAGAVVQQAASGSEALATVRFWEPDIVVSDIGMAGLDGYQLRRALFRVLPTTPALALTAYAAPADERRAMEAGFQGYLPKPVDRNRLINKLVQILQPQPEA